jgi:lipopolysaccharide assembly protein A
MRWIHLAVVVVLIAAMATFAIQNLEIVTLSFLGFGVRTPVALLTTGVYVLGAITGSSLFALIRRSVQGAVPGRVAA